jgi:hypothetical protein
MTRLPDAAESRRLGDIETQKADKLPDGNKKEGHRRKAQSHEDSAHSQDWQHSHLNKPTGA